MDRKAGEDNNGLNTINRNPKKKMKEVARIKPDISTYAAKTQGTCVLKRTGDLVERENVSTFKFVSQPHVRARAAEETVRNSLGSWAFYVSNFTEETELFTVG